MAIETKKAILVVSYGTSYRGALEKAIGGIEKAIAEVFPDYKVYRAFTSQHIIDKVKRISGQEVDNVEQALERIVSDGIKELIVQQTHLLKDSRYDKLNGILDGYKERFEKLILAEPLLSSDEDAKAVVTEIVETTKEQDDGKTAICLIGHGTDGETGEVYTKVQKILIDLGYCNYYVGTISAEPNLKDICKVFKQKGKYKRVVILPLMLVSGFHVRKDIMGKKEDSWKNVLEGDGYVFECIQHGLGENPVIQQIYVSHVRDVIL